MIRKIILTMLVLTTFMFAAVVVNAQEGSPEFPTDNDVNAIAKQLYCPVCPNTPLDVCETQACIDWRNQIKDQLTDGWTEQEIIDYFVVQYGERVLAEPQRKGFTSLVWFLPVSAVILGIVIVWQILKTWRARQTLMPVPPSTEHQISGEILEQIEKEVQEID